MIRRQVQEHSDIRAELLNPLKLKAAQLHHRNRLRVHLVHARDERGSYIPRQNRVIAGGAQNVVNQCRGRGLSIRTRDPDQFSLQKPVRQFNLAPYRYPLRPRQLQERIIRGDTGARHNQILCLVGTLVVPAQFQRHPSLSQLCRRVAQFALRAYVRGRNDCVVSCAEKGRRHSGPCQTHDQHALLSQLDRSRHVTSSPIPRALLGAGFQAAFLSQSPRRFRALEKIASAAARYLLLSSAPPSYRNFSVVSANSANTSAAIQNRTITLLSLHPNNSK